MKSIELNHPKVLAFILLVLELALILYSTFIVAENHARYSGNDKIDTENMQLTFKEDVSFEEKTETIDIPKGQVIKPQFINGDTVGFYYSATGLSAEECKSVDPSQREEKGIYYLNAKPENFEEHEELQRLWNEHVKQSDDIKLKVFLKRYVPVVCLCFVWLVVWIILCRKQKAGLLYVMDIILIPVFLILSLFLFTN